MPRFFLEGVLLAILTLFRRLLTDDAAGAALTGVVRAAVVFLAGGTAGLSTGATSGLAFGPIGIFSFSEFVHWLRRCASRAAWTAGSNKAIKTQMIAVRTSHSVNGESPRG